MKPLIVALFLSIMSFEAFSYSCVLYVEPYRAETIELTLVDGKIDAEEVKVNGRNEYGATVVGDSDGSLKITTPYKKVLLDIPASVSRTEWNHQSKGQFRTSDSRVLTGKININERPVDRLLEIFVDCD